MSTTVKHFHSAMSGAPVLSGTAGSLIAVLDACLVTGFGLKTVDSLTVSGGVATVTFSTGHSFEVDTVAQITGADTGSLNGDKTVLETTTNTIKFAAPDVADGTITGTMSAKLAPAGWEKAFSGTNVAAYKSLSPLALGGGMYLRVDDTYGKTARVVGYESMSDVSTGTGPFPTPGQITGGGYWGKSNAQNSNPVKWLIASNGRTFYIHILPRVSEDISFNVGVSRMFGDAKPRRPSGDAFAVILNCSFENGGYSFDGSLDTPKYLSRSFVPRSYTGLGTAQMLQVIPYCGNSLASSGMDTLMGGFPPNVSGELLLSKQYLRDPSGAPRADLPGFISNPQNGSGSILRFLDKVRGSGDYAGRTLVCLNPTPSDSGALTSNALSLIDITGPW